MTYRTYHLIQYLIQGGAGSGGARSAAVRQGRACIIVNHRSSTGEARLGNAESGKAGYDVVRLGKVVS